MLHRFASNPRSSRVDPGRTHRLGFLRSLVIAWLGAVLLSFEAGAQSAYVTRAWWSLWSLPSDADRVMAYMTSVHIHHFDEGWSNDRVLAVVYRGLYAGTFRTTHGPRAWTAGVERAWISGSAGPVAAMLGFRAGLVYGYDERLGWLAEEFPVLPFAEPLVYVSAGPLAVDFAYAWAVFSLSAAIRF